MIVSRGNFGEALKRFSKPGPKAVDCETTGLKWYSGDRLFSLILADAQGPCYFNFNTHEDHLGGRAPEAFTLPWSWLCNMAEVFRNQDSLWFAHNAKFDLSMLAMEGLWLAGKVHCTEVVARLLHSGFMKYNLEYCVARMCRDLKISISKSDLVYEYVMKHKLYKQVSVRGKDRVIKELHYHKVPFELISQYGLNDGQIEFQLGMYQLAQIQRIIDTKNPDLGPLVENEYQMVKTATRMGLHGMPVDPDYIEGAMIYESDRMTQAEAQYREHTGRDFVDSGVQFAEFFDKAKIPYKKTAKGNPSFDAASLDTMDHPVVDLIKTHRDANKKVATYYSSFLYYQAGNRVFADMRQAGTATGRVSYRDPNMQNVPKEEDPADEFRVRCCFVPPPDHCFFMPDYDQMEYRMMLDQAGEMGVIKLILEGLDVHQATAQLMGVSRQAAKTINFMLLYGGGAAKLAAALKITLQQAKELKALYFAKLPRVKKWIYKVSEGAEINGYTKNWFGRVCHIDKNFGYKAPNYRIQGGCADVVKIAMNRCDRVLDGFQSKMLIQVHDELLFQLHKDELELAPKLVEAMQGVYPYQHLPLTAGPGHSWKSWGDKVDGYPST